MVQLADRGERAQLDGKLLAVLSREALARAAAIAVRPLGWGDPEPTSTGVAVGRRQPVILLPGLDGNRAHLLLLRLFLTRRGWSWVWPVNRADRFGVLSAEADALVPRIETLLRRSGADQVDIVAFSTGGLVVAWALRHHPELQTRIRRLVTIATPWQGTKTAVFGRTPGHQEIAWGSHVLDGLCPPPVPTVCIWSPDDPGVVPAESALPRHGVESVRIDAAGHVEMLASSRVFRAVQAALDTPAIAGSVPEAPS